jgi:archaellum biogenesis protein FlaJ (TadC family)
VTREGSTVQADAAAPVEQLQPIGTARVTIAAAATFLSLLCVVLAIIAGVNNGLMVLATVFLLVLIWAVGAHRLAFWIAFWKDLS